MSQNDLFSQLDNDCKTESFDHILNIIQDKNGDAFYNIPGAIQNPWPIDNSHCCKGRPGTLTQSETQFIINFVQTLGVTKENASDFIGTHIPYKHHNIEYEVFLLRNLPKTGIGLRYGEHDMYYPDFALFFKKKDENSGIVTLLDTKGLKSEMNEKGFGHYKYLSNTLSIAEINNQVSAYFKNWRYRGCFVSTSKIEALAFPDIVNKNPEAYKKADRYKRFGIFFESNAYNDLIEWILSDENCCSENTSQLLLEAQNLLDDSVDQGNFPGGYIGILFKSMTHYGIPEDSAINIIFEIVFRHDDLRAAQEHIKEKLSDILKDKAGLKDLKVDDIETSSIINKFGKSISGQENKSYGPLINDLKKNPHEMSATPISNTAYFGEAHEQVES